MEIGQSFIWKKHGKLAQGRYITPKNFKLMSTCGMKCYPPNDMLSSYWVYCYNDFELHIFEQLCRNKNYIKKLEHVDIVTKCIEQLIDNRYYCQNCRRWKEKKKTSLWIIEI
jgi:hypothetical protein